MMSETIINNDAIPINERQDTSSNSTSASNKSYSKIKQASDNDHGCPSPHPSPLQLPSSRSGGWSGRLISRILPLSCKGHGESNPIPFRLDAKELECLVVATMEHTQQHSNNNDDENDDDNDDNDDEKKYRERTRNGIEKQQHRMDVVDNRTTVPFAPLRSPTNRYYISLDLYLRRYHDNNSHNCKTTTTTTVTDDDQEVHVHLNRDADESIETTVRRLELSTAKKILSVTGNKGSTTNGRRKKNTQKGKQSQNVVKSSSDSSCFLVSSNGIDDDGDGKLERNAIEKRCEILPTEHMTSAELWEMIAVRYGSSSLSSCRGHTIDHDDDNDGSQNKILLSLFHPNNTTSTVPPSPSSNKLQDGLPVPIPSSSNNITIDVQSCPPTILSIQTFENFNTRLFVGVPIVVEATVLFASHTVISWFIDGVLLSEEDVGGGGGGPCFTPSARHIGGELSVLIRPVRDGDHDGRGCEEAYRFGNVVECRPSMPIVDAVRGGGRVDDGGGIWSNNDHQQQQLEQTCSTQIRVLNYNILADYYTTRDQEQSRMSTHCPSKFLIKTRRMPLILAEILHYGADLICLQEVDGPIFDSLLEPVMRCRGYDGYYSNKVSTTQREGCAMFWLRDVFDVVEESSYSVRDLFNCDDDGGDGVEDGSEVVTCNEQQQEKLVSNSNITNSPKQTRQRQRHPQNNNLRWESMDDISTLLRNHDELRKVTMEKIGQIVQVATLRLKKGMRQRGGRQVVSGGESPSNSTTAIDKIAIDNDNEPKHVVVANTHLYYHPMADHIRAMQTYVICKKVDEIRRRRDYCSRAYTTIDNEGDDDVCKIPFILCGDLNSDPLSGAAQLLLGGSVLPCHRDCWKYLDEFKWAMSDDDGGGGDGDERDDQRQEHIGTTQNLGARDRVRNHRTTHNGQDDESLKRDTVITSTVIISPTPTLPPSIHLPHSFPKLISGCFPMPKFTNYALGFIETLDYVLASEPSRTEPYGFCQLSSAPMPSADMVEHYVAMPNEFMPSDHVSIVCDLEWTKYG